MNFGSTSFRWALLSMTCQSGSGKRPSNVNAERSFTCEKNAPRDPNQLPKMIVGIAGAVDGFVAMADAIKWIGCEAMVWLWNKRETMKQVAG